MWCLVTQPNSVVFEVEVDPKSIGEECLLKACKNLGISVEADYFGLKYTNHKGEELWLNLRNAIDQIGSTLLARFALHVKFWVPPHLIQLDATKTQFYLSARKDLIERKLRASDWDSIANVIALIAQAEHGDYDPLNPPHDLYSQFAHVTPENDADPKPDNLLSTIVTKHKEIKGMKTTRAEYWLLKAVSVFDSFGEEIFTGKMASDTMSLGVGPHGILVYRKHSHKNSIPYTAIKNAHVDKKKFRLEYLASHMDATWLELKLESSHAASSLLRAITEKHAFYHCETVRSVVTTQCIRDFKGTLISIFNEDSPLGKKYVFDIKKTFREIYDDARRAIYQANAQTDSNGVVATSTPPKRTRRSAASASPPATTSGRSHSPAPDDNNDDETQSDYYTRACAKNSFGFVFDDDFEAGRACVTCDDTRDKCKAIEERLTRLLDAITCRICMDRHINAAFLPCAHALACDQCANRCDTCPLCRAHVDHVQKVYLPLQSEHARVDDSLTIATSAAGSRASLVGGGVEA